MPLGHINYKPVPVVFLVMAALLSSVTAHASVYKCIENGKTVFRDEPCKQGQGQRFNLGATIEDDDPTGTRGSVSGNFSVDSASVGINDALGILNRSSNEVSLYLVPDRFSAAEVQHFQDTGDASVLQQRPPLDPVLSDRYPFLNLVVRFTKAKSLTRENIESAELRFHGLGNGDQPLVVKLAADEVLPALRQFSLFEDVVQGDIDLEAEQELDREGKRINWRLSIRAPIYYH